MGEVARTNGTPALRIAEGDPDRIRQQIEETRQELGDTIAALAAKTDVKQQARDRVEGAKQRAVAKRDELMGKAQETSPGATERATQLSQSAVAHARANPLQAIALGAAVAGFLVGRITKRR